MNKHYLHIVLVGFLIALFTPSLSYAQEKQIARFFLSYSQKEAPVVLNTLRQNLMHSVTEKALAAQTASFKFIPPSYIQYPDLNSRRDAKEFMGLVYRKHSYMDLEKATPTDLAISALMDNSERWVVFALNQGADPLATLETAIRSGNEEMANKLMTTYGINPNGTLANGELMLWEIQGTSEIPLWFLARQDVNWNVLKNGEPLIFSTLRNEWKRKHHFHSLIARVDPFLTNANGETPFHLASALTALAEELPAGYQIPKAILNMPDHNGNTPLHWAASSGNIANYRYLVRLGANPTLPNRRGETPVGILTQKAAQISELPNPQSFGNMIDQTVSHTKR